MVKDTPNGIGATTRIARWISGAWEDPFSDRALRCARHALLDWIGVSLAGAREPVVEKLVKSATDDGEVGIACLIGRSDKLTPAFAALVNGTASHALDFDDINKRMRGHPTVTIMPAILASANPERHSIGDVMDAFSAGVEVACIVGEMVGAAHYNKGFHTTGTVGTVAAAAGCARLLRLDALETERALALAATQAAGLRTMFGSMAKPLHAGKAAMSGYLAARWALAGLTAGHGALESNQGFGPTLSQDFTARRIRPDTTAPFGVEENIFKYHATCYYVHSALDALYELSSENEIELNDITSIEIGLLPDLHSVCDILEPKSGLEVKFSIRHLAAMTIMRIDTGDIHQYTEACAADPALAGIRSKVSVVPEHFDSRTTARVRIDVRSGRTVEVTLDVGVPADDLGRQELRLSQKFSALATPVLGEERARSLRTSILEMDYDLPLNVLMGYVQGRDRHA